MPKDMVGTELAAMYKDELGIFTGKKIAELNSTKALLEEQLKDNIISQSKFNQLLADIESQIDFYINGILLNNDVIPPIIPLSE